MVSKTVSQEFSNAEHLKTSQQSSYAKFQNI